MSPDLRVEEESIDDGHTVVQAPDGRVSLNALLRQVIKLVIPIDLGNILWIGSQMITIMYVGHHLGESGMSQYSAGVLFFNMTAMSIVTGLNSAIDTISSQAFGRNPRSPVIGETLQRAFVINFFLWIIMTIIFIYSEPIMVLVFGQGVGEGAAKFLAMCPLYLLVQIINGVISKTFCAQRLPLLVVYGNASAAIVSPIANYFLTPMGIEGAALSHTLSMGMCAIFFILICCFHPKVIVREAQWPSPVLRRKEGWIEFLRIGLPSTVAVCSEWWAFEIQALFAISISPFALAVHGVAMSIMSAMFSVALGLSVAASTMVGNALGSQRPLFALQYAKFIVVCDIILGAFTAICVGYFGGHIARLYTNVPEIAAAVESVMPLVIICHVGDSLQFCLQGVYRGVGRPKQAAHAVVFTLWLVGLPASALYVFWFDWGVKGILAGLLTGFSFEIPYLCYIMSQWDWTTLALEAHASTTAQEFTLVESVNQSEVNFQEEENNEWSSTKEDDLRSVEVCTGETKDLST